MALSANTIRPYDTDGPNTNNELGVKASSTIYEGSAVGLTAGYARALVAADTFVGFALAKVIGTSADGGATVNVRKHGRVQLSVTDVAVTNQGQNVYASDDGTFSLVPEGNSLVGTVHRFISTGVAVVEF
jgi:hypothetical protein